MAEVWDKQAIFLQNLRDAGCDEETVATCLHLAEEQEAGALLRILSAHRNGLLETVHSCQKEIDCLDYLVYSIEKKKEKDI